MSQIKLLHSGGNGVSIVAPDSNPASDRTLKLPSDGDGTILTTNSSVGKILQVVQTQILTTSSTSSSSFADTALVRTITPTSASNKILCMVDMKVGGSQPSDVVFKLVRFSSDGTGYNIAYSTVSTSQKGFYQSYYTNADAGRGYYGLDSVGVDSLDTAIDANQHSYRVQWRAQQGTAYLNRTGYSTTQGSYSGTGCSTITLMEVAA